MSLSGLTDASRTPEPGEIAALLGDRLEQWKRLVDLVSHNHAPVTEVWNFGGPKIGWTLRLKQKDRIVLYMIPQAGTFLVGLVLGERAWEAARQLEQPEPIRALLEEARAMPKGVGSAYPSTATRT